MNRDDVIRMAQNCGWVIYEDMPYMDVQAVQDALIERLERFAALVAAAEREACAKACEDLRDLREEARAALRAADALKTGDEDDMLRALRHESNVHLYNCGLDHAAAAIRAKGTQ